MYVFQIIKVGEHCVMWNKLRFQWKTANNISKKCILYFVGYLMLLELRSKTLLEYLESTTIIFSRYIS